MAPRKALKVSTSSTAHRAAEAQAAAQRGAASAGADLGELVAQEEAPQAAIEQTGKEASKTSEAKVAEARAPEVKVPSAGAPGTIEAEVVEASAADPVARDTEMEAGQALVPPPVQDLPPSQESAREVRVHSILSDDTSRGKGVADVEVASTVEQPAPTSGEGSATLVRVQPEPHGWDHPRVLWRSRDDPKGEPLFALEDMAEGDARAPSSNTAV